MASHQASVAASEDKKVPIRDDQSTRVTQSSSTGSANLPEFPIEDVFRKWIKNEHQREILSGIYATGGDWEGWVRVEIDLESRRAFSIRNKQPVREVEVYKRAEEWADLVLKRDKKHRGLIIELVCEDKFANKGSLIVNSIRGEMDKIRELKEKYKGYTFRVLAVTYSEAAETAVMGLGFTVMPGVEVDQDISADELKEYASDEQPVTIRVFQKIVPSGSAGDGVDEITESLGGLSPVDKAAPDEQPVTLRVFQKMIPSGSAGDGVDEVTESLGELSPDDKAADDKAAASSNNGGGSGTS